MRVFHAPRHAIWACCPSRGFNLARKGRTPSVASFPYAAFGGNGNRARFRTFGGAVGILLGRGISMAVRRLMHWPTALSVPAVIAAVVVSVSVGVVFGFYPAWKASRLDPIDALRYE